MINNMIKKGDWFQFADGLFKLYECPEDATMAYMYQMIYENGEYIEGEMYQFSLSFIHLYMKPYKPYEEGKADDT